MQRVSIFALVYHTINVYDKKSHMKYISMDHPYIAFWAAAVNYHI